MSMRLFIVDVHQMAGLSLRCRVAGFLQSAADLGRRAVARFRSLVEGPIEGTVSVRVPIRASMTASRRRSPLLVHLLR